MSGIQLQQVTKQYKEGTSTVTALEEASLTVTPGELIAIMGPSGSGKSTLLSIIGALIHATSGKVIVNGKDVGALNEKQLADFRLNEIGFILQTSNLIPYLSVIDQLVLIKRMSGKVNKEDRQFAKSLLNELGLENKLHKKPNELSGGERQRVAIARAFFNQPSIILADEPTASLDSKRAHEVVKLISNEVKKRNTAAIMVTHDERMLAYCDQVYHMEDGILKSNKI
ncbi:MULTISPECIES: ABC transporter ATP-binding protein [Bacillus]|uniref:ABC transporter ATP-binding protein n=1 Tax=Bacillus TaxID=1386 RepID=UPI00077A8CF6|nr:MULTISPECIES: ABC transporter ATP-binding protein [Bacillus cereus group]OTY50826.1 hemin ABC transporter ATP-binding protein [Bacillus thuringiensis serovar graciosensis]KXY76215.1 hemin ABC transporter ATP-binding protein [Bacillus cereus]MBG9521860.1 hemin ABC transporter ATP-binding protein [Bacillus thuringiensis]MBG9939085.1 hemin ABC transporter ATP-binding protein [Bacillus tropicus]MED2992356.1 ABC transporter ATP-binding protein [Bacillus tropicus]